MSLKITEGHTTAARPSAELPPADPARPKWVAFRARRDPDWTAAASTRHSWEWGKTSYKVDGVHTFEGKLVWFSQPTNPHAGGGASTQSFDDFMQRGPQQAAIPDDALDELYDVVRTILESA